MAETDKRIGSAFGIYVQGVKIAETTSFSISSSMNTANVTSSESGASEELLPTYGSDSISFDFLEAPAAGSGTPAKYNYKDLYDLKKAKTRILVQGFDVGAGGGADQEYFTGYGYITDLSADFPFDGAVSGSGTISISGGLTFTDIT